jgi:hypothetical protein
MKPTCSGKAKKVLHISMWVGGWVWAWAWVHRRGRVLARV